MSNYFISVLTNPSRDLTQPIQVEVSGLIVPVEKLSVNKEATRDFNEARPLHLWRLCCLTRGE